MRPNFTNYWLINACLCLLLLSVSNNNLLAQCDVIITGGDEAVCNGECITLIAEGDFDTVIWNTGESSSMITVCESGTYEVTVANTLEACTGSATTEITIYEPIVTWADSWAMCEFDAEVFMNTTGGSGSGYYYDWSEGFLDGPGPSFWGVPPGTWEVTVTDDAGCSELVWVDVWWMEPMTIDITTTNATCGMNNGSAVLNVWGGAAPYVFTWSDGTNGPNEVTGLASGTYTIDVTDSNGCWQSMSFVIVDAGGNMNPAIATATTTLCTGCCTVLSLETTGTINDYIWSTGETTPSITICAPGDYTVTVNDDLGCSEVASYNMQPTNAVDYNQILGTIYLDENENGVQDEDENGVGNHLVVVQPGLVYALTDTAGNYTAYVDTNTINHSVSWMAEQYWMQISTPETYEVTLPTMSGQTVVNNDFGLQMIPVHDVAVNLIPGTARPGFLVNYWISYRNLGNQTESGTITFTHDAHVSYISANEDYATYMDDVLTWDYSDLAPGEYRMINVVMQVDFPPTVNIGDVLTSDIRITPFDNDLYRDNNIEVEYQTVIGSYDPNDKQVSPQGEFAQGYVNPAQELTYKIRFQNTGTDVAFNVRIVDSLSQNLDISTLEFLGESHPVSRYIEGNGVVTWQFNNIMLPDSTTNEVASHGFVEYRISPKEGLDQNSLIENTAQIYFDYNLPIITNTTQNTLSSNFNIVGLKDVVDMQELLSSKVYPNPFSQQAIIQVNGETTTQKNIHLKVYAIDGKMVYTQANVSLSETKIQASDLGEGIFFYQLYDSQAKLLSKGKLVVVGE